jgi:glycosyltransferase involved in cell wall biosynthesis
MKVSIRLMTYNHSDYIVDALNGINEQITNFKFEVVIGDDFSTDDTLLKINEFKITNPNLSLRVLDRKIGDVYYVLRQERGRLFNFVDIINNCKGEYIALLDGDDYWTDPLKLQKQFDFMEAKKSYNYCGHKSSRSVNEAITKIPLKIKEFSFRELVFKNCLNTATLFFRKSAIQNIPDYFRSMPAGDWGLQLIAIKNSKAFVLGDYMSVYREHDKGLWSGIGNKEKCMLGVETLEAIKEFYPDK